MALVMGFLLVGCTSAPQYFELGVYDNAPEDQLCTLEIAGGLKVVGFNGTGVSWGENGTGDGEDKLSSNAWRAQQKGSKWKTTIRIPAGDHTLQANLFLWDYNAMPGKEIFAGQRAGYIRATGLEISYDFEPGKTYFLRPVLITRDLLFGEVEVIEYNNSGPTGTFQAVRLRLDENNIPVTNGNTIFR